MNRRIFAPAAILVLAVVLSGCAGAVPWNDQTKAGLTVAEVEWCESAETADKYLCGARIVDGKEKKDVTLTIRLPNKAEVHYSAQGVKAFPAHKVRAAVEEAISADVKDSAPGIVDSLVESLVKVLGP